MKKQWIIYILLMVLVFGSFGFRNVSSFHRNETPVKWVSIEEAIALQKKKPKKMFIDMYTDWCGWCKRMDATTFTDPTVAAFLNEHFYCVKFNAEQKNPVVFQGRTFNFVASGSRGYHELAAALLDGQLGYPSFVYLNEKLERITISPGYKQPAQILPELKYVGGGYYETLKYSEYLSKEQ
jgi:thioredoxin-related protein